MFNDAPLTLSASGLEPDRADLESVMPSDSVSQIGSRNRPPSEIARSAGRSSSSDQNVLPSVEIPVINRHIARYRQIHRDMTPYLLSQLCRAPARPQQSKLSHLQVLCRLVQTDRLHITGHQVFMTSAGSAVRIHPTIMEASVFSIPSA